MGRAAATRVDRQRELEVRVTLEEGDASGVAAGAGGGVRGRAARAQAAARVVRAVGARVGEVAARAAQRALHEAQHRTHDEPVAVARAVRLVERRRLLHLAAVVALHRTTRARRVPRHRVAQHLSHQQLLLLELLASAKHERFGHKR